jgi:hypothetical protein
MAGIGNGGNTIHPITRKGPLPPGQTIAAPSGAGSIVTTGGGLVRVKPVVPIMRSRVPVVPVVHENHLPQFNATVRTFGGDEAMGFGKFGT